MRPCAFRSSTSSVEWLVAARVRGRGIHDALLKGLSQKVTFRSERIGGEKASIAQRQGGNGADAGLALLQKGKILLIGGNAKALEHATGAARGKSVETTDEWKEAFESTDMRNVSACAFVTRRLWWKLPAKAESDGRQALDRIGTIAMSASRSDNMEQARIWVEKAPALTAWALDKSLKELEEMPERLATAQCRTRLKRMGLGLFPYSNDYVGGFAAVVLDDDFEDNNISNWRNHPVVRNVVSYPPPPGLNPLPRVRNGRVQGVGTGNNRICPWMVKPVSLPHAGNVGWDHVAAVSCRGGAVAGAAGPVRGRRMRRPYKQKRRCRAWRKSRAAPPWRTSSVRSSRPLPPRLVAPSGTKGRSPMELSHVVAHKVAWHVVQTWTFQQSRTV